MVWFCFLTAGAVTMNNERPVLELVLVGCCAFITWMQCTKRKTSFKLSSSVINGCPEKRLWTVDWKDGHSNDLNWSQMQLSEKVHHCHQLDIFGSQWRLVAAAVGCSPVNPLNVFSLFQQNLVHYFLTQYAEMKFLWHNRITRRVGSSK